MSIREDKGRINFLKSDFVTSFGVFEVFSEPFVGLNKASVKSETNHANTSLNNATIYLKPMCVKNQKLNGVQHTQNTLC